MRLARQRWNYERAHGSVLIIVLWVAFGLVSIALYFADAMRFELRAADHRVAGLEANQAIEGASRYVTYLLTNPVEPGVMPDIQTYQREEVFVGDSTFWLIGRGDDLIAPDAPYFSLVDEASKLNLNTATREMLELLPRMTPELAAAIIDWRDSDSEPSQGGAEDETYLRRIPSYRCKNAPFETVDELRLVFGMDLEILYGEDWNRNGVLDPNENDGSASPPNDNRDGRLDPGLAEYVTVVSLEPNTRSDGSARINVSNQQSRQQLQQLLEETFGEDRARDILAQLGAGQGARSLLEFFMRTQLSADEFALIEGDLTVTNAQTIAGLVNVNTASAAVLACIPGLDQGKAEEMVNFRRSNPGRLNTVAWVAEVLDEQQAVRAGPYLTGRTSQFTADIAAVGRHGRGYQRIRYTFDVSEGTPKILQRQELTHLGWALGKTVRQTLLAAKGNR
jgi:DNA uptake protein ComE-like DNA-binding protein